MIKITTLTVTCLFLFATYAYCEKLEYLIDRGYNNELSNLLSKTKACSQELTTLTKKDKNLQNNHELLIISHELDILLYSISSLINAIAMENIHASEGQISKKTIIILIVHLKEEYKLASLSFESLKVSLLLTKDNLTKEKAKEAMGFVDEYGKIVDKISLSLTSYIHNNLSSPK